MIYIDFTGGTHGNFLAYSINALDDNTKNYQVFNSHGTAHLNYPKKLAVANHYSFFDMSLDKNCPKISITVKPTNEDSLLVNLLMFTRAGDHNFDLETFAETLYDQIVDTPFYEGIKSSLRHYGIDLDHARSVRKSILRESFKINFLDPANNSILKLGLDQRYLDTSLCVYFRDFYCVDSYLTMLQKIIKHFELPYSVDTNWYTLLWENFISKIDALALEQNAISVYNAVNDCKHMPIKLNIIQEAWLDARLQRLYGIEMPPETDDYFKTTTDIVKFLQTNNSNT